MKIIILLSILAVSWGRRTYRNPLENPDLYQGDIAGIDPHLVSSGSLYYDSANQMKTCQGSFCVPNLNIIEEGKTNCGLNSRFNCRRFSDDISGCQVIYSQFGLAIHQNDHQARRRFVEWAQNEMAVVPDFHKRIFFSDEAHFWLNGYVNKQNCRIWSESNPQGYVETPLYPEKLTVWCALWAGGILLQKR
ncbi:putative DD41D transposase [Trichonephila clavipes]|nr:putative DD41D transposase [Trichonephila clavipes]